MSSSVGWLGRRRAGTPPLSGSFPRQRQVKLRYLLWSFGLAYALEPPGSPGQHDCLMKPESFIQLIESGNIATVEEEWMRLVEAAAEAPALEARESGGR